ncbi:MAG: site-specific integrase [Anaerocolumna sp.]
MDKQNNAGAIASNAGDDFHQIWAGKKLLDILKPNSKLTAISVEGPTWADSIEIEDEQKLYSIDLAEYYGAITKQQEKAFLDFVKNDKHFSRYYDGIFILFRTGLRISEFCGLTIGDIDFEQKRISVTHQLQRKRDMEYIMEEPKTSSGIRYIPMSQDVSECFRHILSKRKKPKVEPMIDGMLVCQRYFALS